MQIYILIFLSNPLSHYLSFTLFPSISLSLCIYLYHYLYLFLSISLSLSSRYCRIDEDTCCLLYSKTKDQADPTSIDLRQITDIRAYEKTKGGTGGKKGPDAQRFNLDMGDGDGGGRVYKFKAKDTAEGERWMTVLEDWREYALLTTEC